MLAGRPSVDMIILVCNASLAKAKRHEGKLSTIRCFVDNALARAALSTAFFFLSVFLSYLRTLVLNVEHVFVR